MRHSEGSGSRPAGPAENPTRTGGTAAKATILLVEDNPDNQEIYRIILTHNGYSVLQAWDGERGVGMARDHGPDLILMDLTMPVIDGLTATRMLKSDPATAAIPIIALTAHATQEDQAAAEAAGCESFLPKPAAPKEVAAEVRRVLAAPGHGRQRAPAGG